MGVTGRGVLGGSAAILAMLIVAGPAAATPRHAARRPPPPHATPRRAASADPHVSLVASPSTIVSGRPVTLSGRVVNTTTGSVVRLYKSAYPYRSSALVRTATPAADGSFSFTVFPDRDARYRAIVSGTPAHAVVQVLVSGRTVTKVKALPLGQAGVTIVVFHPATCGGAAPRPGGRSEPGSHGSFTTIVATRTVRLSPFATALSATATLPAGRFPLACVLSRPRRPRAAQRPPAARLHRARLLRRRLLAGRLPGARASRTRRRIPGRPRRTDRVCGRRQRGPDVRRPRTLDVRVRERRQGDAAGRLPATPRRPRPAHGRLVQQLVPVPDDQRLGQLQPPTQTWSIVGDSGLYSVAHAGRNDRLLDRRDLGKRPDQRCRSGEVLLRDGFADPAGNSSAMLASCSRRSPDSRAGASPRSRVRTATRSSSRAAGAAPASDSSCTRSGVWSEAGGRSRSR